MVTKSATSYKQQVSSIVRQVTALAAVIVGSLQSSNVISGKYGWVLTLIGGSILAVEHYVSDPSTGNSGSTPST